MRCSTEIGTLGFGSASSVLAFLFIPLLAGSLLAGCDQKDGSQETNAKTSVQKGSEASRRAAERAAKAARAEAKAKAEQKAKPRSKATEAPDEIGTLPEGIGLKVGSEVPSGKAEDLEGETIALDEFEEGPTLLVFYRGGWCPYCNFQVREISEAAKEFEARGVKPVLISVDTVDEASKTSATYDIPFPVLSDPDLDVHEAFNVLNEVDDETYERLKKMGMDLEKSSGKKHHTIAVPAVFLLEGGTITFAHAEKDYKTRPSTEQLLNKLDELGHEKQG